MEINPQSASAKQTQPQRISGRPKILIVDDEPRVLRSLQAALKSKFDIYLAEDAAQAKQEFGQREYIDVIVSDERMPQCTGLELLKWSRENYPDSIRILLSSTDFVAKRDAIRTADIYRCISKPWNTQEFVEVLERAVSKLQISDRRKFEEPRSLRRERRSGSSRYSSLAVLDRNENYRDEYKQVVQDIEGFSEIYYQDSAKELRRSLLHVANIGVLVIDLTIGEDVAAELIREINQRNSSVMIIVTSDPHSIRNFMPMVGGQAIYDFIAKPLSARRIQSVVAGALQQHFIKMRNH